MINFEAVESYWLSHKMNNIHLVTIMWHILCECCRETKSSLREENDKLVDRLAALWESCKELHGVCTQYGLSVPLDCRQVSSDQHGHLLSIQWQNLHNKSSWQGLCFKQVTINHLENLNWPKLDSKQKSNVFCFVRSQL